ncbi:MAG: hypothetical protein KIT14_12310 [bacterium]|nr:hypothetical protein [bacterium]
MTHATRTRLAAALTLALLPSLAAAQFGNCGPDVEKYCKGVLPGRGRLLRCLESRAADLTPACKQTVGVPTFTNPESACHDDVVKYCRDAAPDKAKVKACLQENAAKLSDACKTALVAHGS